MGLRSRTSSCSIQRDKAQNRPRSGLPWNIETKSKTKMSGLSIVGSKTGCPHQKGERKRRSSPDFLSLSIFRLFCLLLTFNVETKDITIGSHNLHSFKTSCDYHKSCLETHGGIWLGQELWLTEKQLPLLHQLNTQFTARSGMEEAVSRGVWRGRPYGGVSVAWSADLNHVISPLSNYKHKRIVAVELTTTNKNIIFISAYMPFLDSSNRTTCIAEYTDAVSMIETILTDHPHHLFVLGGDLNCELTGDSPFDDIWKEFVLNNRFAYCSIASPPGYTYHHAKLGHKKMNDHFLASHELISDGNCVGWTILDEGENPSDHLPITMNMSITIPSKRVDSVPVTSAPTLKWNKISAHHIQTYSNSLSAAPHSRQFNSAVSCDRCHCQQSDCRDLIQRDYEFIISSIRTADATLPRYGPGVEKEWWTPNLSILKEKSIDIHNLWVSEGRPRCGPTYAERLRVRTAYRAAIRMAQREPKQRAWNRLHSALEFSDSKDFWKTWKSLYSNGKNSFATVVNGCSSKDSIANEFKNSFMENSKPNSQQKVNELNAKFEAQYKSFSDSHASSCDCASYEFSLHNIIDAVCCMSKGKCADADGLTPEHFHNAPLIFLHALKSIFNRILQHSFVPAQF